MRHRRHGAAGGGHERRVSLTAIHPRAAIGAARRVAAVLTFSERSTKKSSLSDGELLAAGILLLLFAAAAASVLRLSTRIASEVPGGRAG